MKNNYSYNPILVRAVQRAINECGYEEPLAETGVVDAHTTEAVYWYQRRNGIPESGVIEDYTLAATACGLPGATFGATGAALAADRARGAKLLRPQAQTPPDQPPPDQGTPGGGAGPNGSGGGGGGGSSDTTSGSKGGSAKHHGLPSWAPTAGLIAGGAVIGALLPIPLAIAHAGVIRAAAGAIVGALASMVVPKAHSQTSFAGELDQYQHAHPAQMQRRRPMALIHGDLESEELTAGDIGMSGSYASLRG